MIQCTPFSHHNGIKDLWCLRKLIHCKGGNIMKYIITCNYLVLDYVYAVFAPNLL